MSYSTQPSSDRPGASGFGRRLRKTCLRVVQLNVEYAVSAGGSLRSSRRSNPRSTAGRRSVYSVIYQSDGSGFSCLGRKTSNLLPRCFHASCWSAFIALTTSFFRLPYKVLHQRTILLTLNMERYVMAATRIMVMIRAVLENLSLILHIDYMSSTSTSDFGNRDCGTYCTKGQGKKKDIYKG